MEKKRILVVDDDPVTTLLLESILKAEGHDVWAFNDAKEALGKMQQISPELIITDICMPEMDGFSLFKQLKQHWFTVNIPVLIITGRGKMADSFIALGAGDYLVKPFESRELLAKIEKLIEQAQKAGPPINAIAIEEKKRNGVPHIGNAVVVLFLVVAVGIAVFVIYSMSASFRQVHPVSEDEQQMVKELMADSLKKK